MLSGRKSSIRTETPATHNDAKISVYTLFLSCVCLSAALCFDFGLAGVLGIAFGGFLIGVLLIGALWFIKIKTGKCMNDSTELVNKYKSYFNGASN